MDVADDDNEGAEEAEAMVVGGADLNTEEEVVVDGNEGAEGLGAVVLADDDEQTGEEVGMVDGDEAETVVAPAEEVEGE